MNRGFHSRDLDYQYRNDVTHGIWAVLHCQGTSFFLAITIFENAFSSILKTCRNILHTDVDEQFEAV